MVSKEPRTPSSASTVTPMEWEKSTTWREVATLYSYEEGVLPSSSSEPSIITLEKPERIAAMHTAGL